MTQSNDEFSMWPGGDRQRIIYNSFSGINYGLQNSNQSAIKLFIIVRSFFDAFIDVPIHIQRDITRA
jgi:hypothetical protein